MSSLFGLDPSGRLVFVGDVPRGLACQCRCVACGEPLIARRGAVREHHFAHVSGREPCEVGYESLLHRYAKQAIQTAGGLVVPVDENVARTLGLHFDASPATHLELVDIEVEKGIQDLRPDLLGHTDQGLAVAIEVAYSSFCDPLKVARFAQLGLPALEIDLRAFTQEGFEPEAVRKAVIDEYQGKDWLWPNPAAGYTTHPVTPVSGAPPTPVAPESPKARLPEEIVTISGRWISIKTFPSGDIAVKAIRYDPDIVSMVRTIARSNQAQYSPRWKSWNVPRWRAEAVRAELRSKAETVSITMQERRGTVAK